MKELMMEVLPTFALPMKIIFEVLRLCVSGWATYYVCYGRVLLFLLGLISMSEVWPASAAFGLQFPILTFLINYKNSFYSI